MCLVKSFYGVCSGKLVFKLDTAGNPIAADLYEIKESNQLIEEYMLLANYLVAQKLVERVGRAAFLRRHREPRSRGMEEVVALAEALGVVIDTTSAYTLQRSLQAVSSLGDNVALQAITALLMRPLSRAEYFIVGDDPSMSWKHFALAIPYYTHFTSPIRRYADVVVHRLLQIAITKENSETSGQIWNGSNDIEELQRIAEHCNLRKDAARDAQMRCDMVYFGIYLSSHEVVSTEAVVISICEKSMTVFLIDYGFAERLFYDKMDHVLSSYDGNSKAVLLSRGGSRHSKHRHITSPYHIPITQPAFTDLRVELLSRVAVRLTSSLDPLVSIHVELVGQSTSN